STLTNASGVYALPVPGTAAQIGLVGKEGEQQTFPGIPYRPFDLNTDVFPGDFGSRSIDPSESTRFTTPPVTTAITPGLYRYQSFAQSPSGKQMTYALAVGPQGMSIDPSSGLVRWNPIASNRGDNEVILKATDADGKMTLQRYTINVEVNTSPIVTSTPPAIALQNVPFQYRIFAQDAEQSTLRYALTIAPAGMTIDAATGLIEWLPSLLSTENITVKIDDQRGSIAEHTFSIAVQTAGTNHAPEFTSGPRAKAILGREFASRIGATDEDNDVLSYSLVSGPSGLTISAQGEVYWQPTTSGSHDIVARVSDNRGGTGEQSYTLSVVSRAPTPDLQITSSPTTAAVVGNLFAYDVTATHGELFELVTSPNGMSIAPSRGTVRWVPTKDQLGVQTVKIRVTDVLGNMVEQSFVIAVRSSSLVPTISSAPLTEGAVGQTYVYAVAVANPSRSPLTYSLSIAPSGMQIDAALGVITWTPSSSQVGPTVASIQVLDAVGNFSSQTFSIVVSAGVVNRPPVTVSTPSIDAVVGTPYAYTMTSDDPEGGTVTYAVRSAPNGFLIH
ncbi:MAG: putative Ig domain-containing protein, partial [Pirellula sp.]